MRLTVICPQAMIPDANELAMAVGLSEADAKTYGEPQWQDAKGNLYAAASLEVSESFIKTATSAMARPVWDADSKISMAAAQRAQAKVMIWGRGADGKPEPDPVASPDYILAMFHPDPLAVLALAGVSLVPDKEDVIEAKPVETVATIRAVR